METQAKRPGETQIDIRKLRGYICSLLFCGALACSAERTGIAVKMMLPEHIKRKKGKAITPSPLFQPIRACLLMQA
jgi:hypothetical protein